MSAATIVFTDIAGFSRKSTAEQRRLVEALNTEIQAALGRLLNPADGSPDLIALPTGDGAALAFLHKERPLWTTETILALVIRLHQWAHTGAGGGIKLRIGVHLGPIEIINDVNQRRNICGDTVNVTQRVMDAAADTQTLFSEAAYRHYIANGQPITVPASGGAVTIAFAGPIEVFAKHGVRLVVYKLTTPQEVPWHTNEDPPAKHLMVVKLTGLPKNVETFGLKMTEAERVALVQLTGERLLPKLLETDPKKKISFHPNLKKLWVFMPSPEAVPNLAIPQSQLSPAFITPELISLQTEKWTEYLVQFQRDHPTVDVKLGIFSFPLYFGASYLNWDRPGGRIHISPCVWGKHSTLWPGYDLEWLGEDPGEVYETYISAIDYLHANTANQLG